MILNEISQAVVTVGVPVEEKTEIWVHDETLLVHLKHSMKKRDMTNFSHICFGLIGIMKYLKLFQCGSFK